MTPASHACDSDAPFPLRTQPTYHITRNQQPTY
jgi:hypothetical protein